jgi:hypothetical protein
MKRTGKVKKVFTQILEPFALGLLALFFILPVITVMNLTPITKQVQKLDILGVTNKDEVIVRLIGGRHEIFNSESLNKVEDFEYSYSVRLGKRASDSYSKPILEIENKSAEGKSISFWGQTLSNTRSDIYLIINEETYRLQDSTGETQTQKISLAPNEEVIVFLALENLSRVQFSEIFDMTIEIQ